MLNADKLQQKTPSELLEIIRLQQEKITSQEDTITTKDKTISSQEGLITTKDKTISSQETLIIQLNDALKPSRHRQFGKSSERDAQSDQLCIFNEAEAAVADVETPEETTEQDTISVPDHQRKKRNRKLPEALPRVEVIHDLDDADKQCQCGCAMTCIGDERSEQLDIIPATAQVIVHVRKKYACKGCKQNIKQAALPKQPIPKSMASPGTLAHVLVAKFQDALPLYRQETIFQRSGINLPRSTLSNWVIRCGDLLKPLVNLIQSDILAYDIAFADETRVQVLREPGRDADKRSFIWLFAGGEPAKFGYVYRYDASRAHDIPLTFLRDFKGYLHCDGFGGYDALSKKLDIQQAGCWYHVRRKFVEASKVSKKDGLAKQAVQFIKRLSDIERDIKQANATADKAKDIRALRARPIINKFKQWLDSKVNTVPSGFPIGKAIEYTLRQWPKLLTYLDDGRLHISNNLSERAIKPFVIGRKNWMFAASVDGADAAATIYSLIETCKVHDVQPYDYLRYVLERIPNATVCDDFEALLPYNCKALI